MKCVILHESPGRLRLHAAASRMTLTQADAWEAYLKALPGVRDAAVYDRTGDLVITYRGSREEILKAVAAFSYEKHGELAPANSSRALNRELRSRGVGVMALCPFWTRTAFFARATGDGGQENVVKKYVAMYEPEQLVQRAWRDAKRGKDVSQYGFVARFQAGLTKLLPHSLVMDVWMRQQKLQ